MKKHFIVLLIFFFSIQAFACSCTCEGDCSFSAVSGGQEFVALVKVIEYSDFLEDGIYGYDGKMPYSMNVEIIKQYKGTESRECIKIWGDNGMLCRPYISNFEIGNYYLIAPSLIESDSQTGKANDYDFFVCWTDYLMVDYENQVAYGEYSWWRKKITLEKFEENLKD
ncbi:MAG: hypothetical protein WD554_01635 [Flavobacteriaceae bacterium]